MQTITLEAGPEAPEAPEVPKKDLDFIGFQMFLEEARVGNAGEKVYARLCTLGEELTKCPIRYYHLAWSEACPLFLRDLRSLTSRIKLCESLKEMIAVVDKHYPMLVGVFVDVFEILKLTEINIKTATQQMADLTDSAPEALLTCQPQRTGPALFGGLTAEEASKYYTPLLFMHPDRIKKKFDLVLDLQKGVYSVLLDFIHTIHTHFRLVEGAPELARWKFKLVHKIDRFAPDIGIDYVYSSIFSDRESWATVFYDDENDQPQRLTCPTAILYHQMPHASWGNMQLTTKSNIQERFHQIVDVEQVMTKAYEEFSISA